MALLQPAKLAGAAIHQSGDRKGWIVAHQFGGALELGDGMGREPQVELDKASFSTAGFEVALAFGVGHRGLASRMAFADPVTSNGRLACQLLSPLPWRLA
jgi:hypothetical protein